jgi:hypothetical protein
MLPPLRIRYAGPAYVRALRRALRCSDPSLTLTSCSLKSSGSPSFISTHILSARNLRLNTWYVSCISLLPHILQPIPKAELFNEHRLETYSDSDLLLHCRKSNHLITVRKEPSVRALSPNLVAKPVGYPHDHRDELRAIEYAETLGIRVPRVRRVIPDPERDAYFLIMDRIQGLTLEQLWPTISLYDNFLVAIQLRRYLRAMRTVTSQSSGGIYSGRTRSEWIQCVYGPIHRATPAIFAQYLNWWVVEFQNGTYPSRPYLRLPTPTHHVFVHQDLAPRNMILNSHKNLWLLDWGRSGFYPEYMEGLGMDTTAMPWINGRTWAAIWGRFKWGLLRWLVGFPFSIQGKAQLAHRAMGTVYNRTIRYKLVRTPYSESDS